ncbi:hypothetical protein OH720_13315 [Pseudomonas sp. WJP1]|uniref:hypothetical protein n=1 Tax=unclassified Pseudomonas TaxID=196821 RepID=UPI0002706A26|nr:MULTISPECIES: hypothetical protein [unclassified Pseudomonas]EJN29047.1 hypothetical protein PMI35_02807 [Pseudomonas sp. GM78]WCM53937.1 hypothetical protein OH720_13315 [Pseudomonas sp. WJP1]
MSFVKVEKNQSSAPSEAEMKKAMIESGGVPGEVSGNNAARTLTYTGLVNHTVYENKLIEIAHGKRTSWNFVWADARAA